MEKKLAICCDQLVERDLSTSIVETFAEIYPDADIYTFAHNKNNILGITQCRKVYSSFLSHWVKNLKSFKRWSFLIPKMGDKFFIPRQYEWVICVTNGLSHAINLEDPQRTKILLYLVGEDLLNLSPQPNFNLLPWKGFLFKKYLQEFSLKNYLREQIRGVLGSSEWVLTVFKEKIQSAEMNYLSLYPVFHLEEFPFVKEFPDASNIYWVGNGDNLSLKEKQQLETIFKNNSKQLVWMDKEKCAGDLFQLVKNAQGILNFGVQIYPYLSLVAISTGLKLVVRNHPLNIEFFSKMEPLQQENINSLKSESDIDFCDTIEEVVQSINKVDFWRKSDSNYRRPIYSFHEGMFRNRLKKFISTLENFNF
jgi:hypothetical protein